MKLLNIFVHKFYPYLYYSYIPYDGVSDIDISFTPDGLEHMYVGLKRPCKP